MHPATGPSGASKTTVRISGAGSSYDNIAFGGPDVCRDDVVAAANRS